MRYGSMLLILAAMLLGAPAAPLAAPLPVPDLALAGSAPSVHRALWPFGRLFGGRRHARRHGYRRGNHARRMRAERAGPGGNRGGGQGNGGGSGGQKLRFQ